MAYTQSNLDALKAALATGELEVQFSDGRRVRYRSIAELREAISVVAAEVATASPARRVREVQINMEDGL